MNVSELATRLAEHVENGFGGDRVKVLDDDGNPYEIVTAEVEDDSDNFVLNIEDSGE